jgi:hypothetical protein
MDPVAGVRDVLLDGAPLGTGCTSITLNISNDGAAADFALGSAAAQGMRMGTLTVGGSAEFYFRTFALYQRFMCGRRLWRKRFFSRDPYRSGASMCGRRLWRKRFFSRDPYRSGASMCSACLRSAHGCWP